MSQLLYALDRVVRRYRLPRTPVFGSPRILTAVAGVSLQLAERESLGIVGESGAGKSTLLRLMLSLEPPDAGRVIYHGRSLRREVQVVFQDPGSALDPRMRVRDIIAEPLQVMRMKEEAGVRVQELLEAVGLEAGAADRFPHEFSGGQRQRIAIARALAPRPRVLLADEPVSALDVSVRAQILNLLEDLRTAFDLSLVLVSHDLSVVRHMCDRVAVMRAGEIVEIGNVKSVFTAPRSPYTRALLDAIPTLPRRRAG